MFGDLKGMDKVVKDLIANALESLEADAKHHERKAQNARKTAQALKKLAPIVIKTFEPPKPFKMPKLTKAQRRQMASGFPGVIVPPAKAS
jgi:hypothetical protein